MNRSIITLVLGLTVGLAGTAQAANSSPASSSPATSAGPAHTKIDFRNAVRAMNDAEHRCRSTVCGPGVKSDTDTNTTSPPVQTADSTPCYSTYCGKR